MTLEEYAAQQVPQAQEPQQANQLDAVAARIDAERLSLLMADARQAIDEYRSPATLLTVITGAIFGKDSAEAAAVAKAIAQDRAPGGSELAIAALREQRRQLNQQAKKLTEQQKAIAEALEKVNAAERELMQAPAADGTLIDVMTFCSNTEPRETLLTEAAALYQQHRRNQAAMGLLYGSLSRQAGYTAGRYDLMQQQELAELKARILEAANG